MVNTGNMPMSLRLSRKPMVHEAVRLGKMAVIGIRPTVHTFRVASAEMKADSQTFSRNFSESVGLLPIATRTVPGQDIQAELPLTLREAAVTHQQTFTVNGETLRITVPAGVENGQVIKLKGHGGKGANGAPAGDLYITFIVQDDPVFKGKVMTSIPI